MGWNRARAFDARCAFATVRKELDGAARAFQAEMRQGLAGDRQSLKMLPSYVGLPTGTETGTYLTVDFGGTNVRAARVRLLGNGRHEIAAKAQKLLKVPGEYDHTGRETTAEALFDFIASLVEEVTQGRDVPYRIGHTFSFPSAQTSLKDATLLAWTKEIAVPGVEGNAVNALLRAALRRRGLKNIEPVAILNDTTAVLLAAAYHEPHTYIGSIYATGHNTCYLEEYGGKCVPMILNLESGAFTGITEQRNRYDVALDRASENPGAQLLEKMVSGRYIGTLFGLAVQDILQLSELPRFTAEEMGAIVAGETGAYARIEALAGASLSNGEKEDVLKLAAAIAARSAGVVAMTFAGILRHRAAMRMAPSRYVAVEGSLYEKFPKLAHVLGQALTIFLQGSGIHPPSTCLVRGGATLGAALAAAMASDEMRKEERI